MADDLVTKTVPVSAEGQPLYAAAGLEWLAEGGASVAQVAHVSPSSISTFRIPRALPTPGNAHRLGEMLARTHAAGAPGWGASPAGYDGPGWMGDAPLTLTATGTGGSWGHFYAEQRIRPYLSAVFSADEATIIETLCAALENGSLDHPQPALVTGQAARTHGDLWSGNVLWSHDGCVLIDPAAQGGHAETDLAALRLFGAPFVDDIVDGYQRISPLAPGWELRIGLHQMHMLMVHCYLFGRSYVPSTLRTAREALALAPPGRA